MRALQERVIIWCMFLIIAAHDLKGNQHSGRYTYVVRYKHGGSLIPVTVVLDYKRQTEYVINMNARSPAKSMTLYDFKERVIAYKDLKNGECFIGRLKHETIQEEDEVLKRLKNPVEGQPLILTLEPDRPSLTPTEVRNMAGHKAAVFCRRMNTWTLMPESDKRREKRDTLRHLERPAATSEDHPESSRSTPHLNKILRTEQNITLRNLTLPESSSLRSNASVSGSHPLIRQPQQHLSTQDLNGVFRFILPRQRSFSDTHEDDTRKTLGDSIHLFTHKASKEQTPSGFPQARSFVPGNEMSLVPSAQNSFSPLNSNNPVIIPSISFTSKPQEKESHGSYGFNNIDSSRVASASSTYPQVGSSIHNLHNTGETVYDYASFHQLPPEAFVLPLTRSSSASTEQSFAFDNHQGFEVLHRGSSSVSNSTVPDGVPESGNKSVIEFKTEANLNPKLEEALPRVFPARLDSLDNEVPTGISSFPLRSYESTGEGNSLHDLKRKGAIQHSESKDSFVDIYAKHLNRTGNNYNETVFSAVSLSSGSDSPSDPSDSRIQIPRWYPEIAKEISIPLEIEVLHHHQEEYAHDIANKTHGVHSLREHEIEDFSSLPSVQTLVPIPVEGLSNRARPEKEIKLLPQISALDGGRSAEKTDKLLINANEGDHKTLEGSPHRHIHNATVPGIFVRTQPTPAPVLTNDTEVINSIPVSSVRQDFVNRISHSGPLHKGDVGDDRRIPKRHHISGGSLAVQDFTIDEGVPSYRNRLPTVSQTSRSHGSAAVDEKSTERRLRQNQQALHGRRRSSAVRNKTHGIPSRGFEEKSPWRKHSPGSSNLINRPGGRVNDQGITFHHRGYAKPGVNDNTYDHHRKRLRVLPPGVSVHPRHPQAPYADLATDAVDTTVPANPLLHARPRLHLRHHRRHQRKRNRIQPPPDLVLPTDANCCSGDSQNCCSRRKRGRHFSNTGCCSQNTEGRRRNVALAPPEAAKNEVTPRKKAEEAAEDRCMKEKMCRTVYKSTKKVLVCRNIQVDGC